ncbi:uncharacterized protein At1g26090, chloroplastic isoform X3 [Humulus lupulus]|uniref:uncharacterized protein At1g26090, chloroplastic isoform X3 n=1 Tax=Humulus lupulus TaxID=3486 RepID=UPI002B402C8E|nr:uncharacterized protein At1g26090, chloroplastic isoform X3 [Humulus lupulus]
MASFSSSPLVLRTPISPSSSVRRRRDASVAILAMATASQKDDTLSSHESTKLVTFLGKGGSGKTTSAVFAAQMLLEPLNRLKQADARLNMTQGVLEKIVGEELGVLPGMDPIFSAYALEKLAGFFRKVAKKNHNKDKFDIVVYDGMSSEEILRMISAASKARLYLKYLRNMAEKTDLGRLAGPSLLRLVDEAMSINGSQSFMSGQLSAEIWDTLEQMLERGSSAFSDPQKFVCFLVMDLNNQISVNSAFRYWGCAIQAGACVSGALGIGSPNSDAESIERVKETFSPLPYAFIPQLSIGSTLDWKTIISNNVNEGARNLLSMPASGSSGLISPVEFNAAKRTVTLLLPGFDKSEIKLYQYRGGSELLVEAGDQRRVIRLPSEIQGKVGGAKFIDRSLLITMR